IDIDLVDKTELINVDRDFRVVDGLERGHDIIGHARQLIGRNGACPGLERQRRHRYGGRSGVRQFTHIKILCAEISASAKRSTSSRVLYMAKEARQVAVTP